MDAETARLENDETNSTTLQRVQIVCHSIWRRYDMVDPHARGVGHETRDISVTLVTWFSVGLIISGIAIYIAIAGLYGHFARQTSSPEPASRIALKPPMDVPSPQLQVNPAMDFESSSKLMSPLTPGIN